MTHIIYVPGLGDRYDPIRKLGLFLWRGDGRKISHFAIRWSDQEETLNEKFARLMDLIKKYPSDRVVLVGESAGGSAVIAFASQHPEVVSRVVTVCGMNHGHSGVNPRLYRSNPAFETSMHRADSAIQKMNPSTRATMLTIYSSRDHTVTPEHTLILDVVAYDLRIAGHMNAILAVLFLRHSLVTKK